MGVGYTTLTLDDTTIADNSVTGIYGIDSLISCTGDPSNDAGVWGNDAGVELLGYFTTDPVLFESDGCDFKGVGGVYTPLFDVLLANVDGDAHEFRFRDDATFSCDATTVTCTR